MLNWPRDAAAGQMERWTKLISRRRFSYGERPCEVGAEPAVRELGFAEIALLQFSMHIHQELTTFGVRCQDIHQSVQDLLAPGLGTNACLLCFLLSP